MRKAFFLLACGGLIGAALVALTTGGWMLHAAQSFLMLLGSSVCVFVVRERVIRKIDTTNGNGIGLIAFLLYCLVCLIATVVASVAAMFIPHTGTYNLVALGVIVLAGLLTARMHA